MEQRGDVEEISRLFAALIRLVHTEGQLLQLISREDKVSADAAEYAASSATRMEQKHAEMIAQMSQPKHDIAAVAKYWAEYFSDIFRLVDIGSIKGSEYERDRVETEKRIYDLSVRIYELTSG